MKILAFFLIMIHMPNACWANHGKHQHHHHATAGPQVSSFYHQLPGTNSYMSVTRYFTTANSQNATKSQDNFHPWNPRFQVPRIEVDNDEWKELLTDYFAESGFLGSNQLLKQVPEGLVNLNYDIHICVHMGTQLQPEESAYPPTAVSYPGSAKLHTLLLLDADQGNQLHWLVTNIPGVKVHQGQIISAYAGPNPGQATGLHRYLIVVMEQESGLIHEELVQSYKSESSCETLQKSVPSLDAFRASLNLSQPIAANYFTEEYNNFVDNINGHCLASVPIQPHPLYK